MISPLFCSFVLVLINYSLMNIKNQGNEALKIEIQNMVNIHFLRLGGRKKEVGAVASVAYLGVFCLLEVAGQQDLQRLAEPRSGSFHRRCRWVCCSACGSATLWSIQKAVTLFLLGFQRRVPFRYHLIKRKERTESSVPSMKLGILLT